MRREIIKYVKGVDRKKGNQELKKWAKTLREENNGTWINLSVISSQSWLAEFAFKYCSKYNHLNISDVVSTENKVSIYHFTHQLLISKSV